jgi:3-keto-5-aminohexanoate cleavage enzyme
LTPTEIASDTYRAYKQGASVVHVHARDDSGDPTYKKEIRSRIFSKIRKKCPEIIICASTSGRCDRDIIHRMEVLEPGPEMASLTPGCVSFFNRPSINTLDEVITLAKSMDKHGVKPELEIFEPSLINTAKYLLSKDTSIFLYILICSRAHPAAFQQTCEISFTWWTPCLPVVPGPPLA